METITYSIKDFENILWSKKEISLPDEIQQYIETISNEVSAPSYQKTPNFTHSDKNNFKKKKFGKSNSSEDFKATKKIEKKGIDKEISNIKLLLNKVTDKTLITICDELKEIMNKLIEEEKIKEEEFIKIGKEIFSIATSNSFYSLMYAKLYKQLIKEFRFLDNIFDENYKSYLSYFNDIKYVNPEENYEEFCNITLVNDNRKAYSKFLCNCLKEQVINENKIINILDELFNMQDEKMNSPNNQELLNEIVNNVEIIFDECKNNLKNCDDKYNEYVIKINEISSMKPTKENSISNKFRFKYMDIKDKL